jgi:predicted nucleic acid-binding protein
MNPATPCILLDTNIVLDLLLGREPWARDAAELLAAVHRRGGRPVVAAHAVTTIFYITARAAGRDRAARAVRELLELVEVVAVDGALLRRAMTSGLLDFEDAVQAAAAEACGARCIATRNLRDFAAATVPAMLPGAAMALFTVTHAHPAPHAPPRTTD